MPSNLHLTPEEKEQIESEGWTLQGDVPFSWTFCAITRCLNEANESELHRKCVEHIPWLPAHDKAIWKMYLATLGTGGFIMSGKENLLAASERGEWLAQRTISEAIKRKMTHGSSTTHRAPEEGDPR